MSAEVSAGTVLSDTHDASGLFAIGCPESRRRHAAAFPEDLREVGTVGETAPGGNLCDGAVRMDQHLLSVLQPDKMKEMSSCDRLDAVLPVSAGREDLDRIIGFMFRKAA